MTIQDEADRNHLKETVESQLTFQGSHTDISKGIALVRKESSTLFREPGAAKPAVILISDGRLEPKKNLQTAYQRLTKDWQALSDLVPFYTLGLGETEIYREFLPDVTGHSLLIQMAQESGGRFYPVRSIEELVETCGKVLRHTKGYGEPAEQEVFRTDESTSGLAFLVIKRLPAQRLCKTGEILLQEPGGKQIDFSQSAGYDEGETRILWHRGEYYDLIVVESPTSGEWSMSLSSGLTPRAVVLIRNSVHLRYMVQREYWDQEKKVIMAWLYDERTGVLSQRPCIISAKFDSGENFQDTDNKLNLHESKEETYLTSLSLAEKEPPVDEYLVQIQAEDKESFFLRRSPVVPVKVNDAYFSFDLPKGSIQKWPMLWKGLTFCVELDSKHQAYPSFREPPKISLYLKKVEDEKSASLSPVELSWQKKENRIEYRIDRADYPLGHYVARVILEERLVSGRSVRIESPGVYFVLLFPVWV